MMKASCWMRSQEGWPPTGWELEIPLLEGYLDLHQTPWGPHRDLVQPLELGVGLLFYESLLICMNIIAMECLCHFIFALLFKYYKESKECCKYKTKFNSKPVFHAVSIACFYYHISLVIRQAFPILSNSKNLDPSYKMI